MGTQGRQPSLCEFTILSVQVTASIEGDGGPAFRQELNILLHLSEGKRNSPMTNTTQGTSAISVAFPLCRCTILDQSTDFQWSCHLPSNLFQTVTDRAWALPPLFLPLPHTFILDESYFNAFLHRGTVLSGGKHWVVYMHLIKNV